MTLSGSDPKIYFFRLAGLVGRLVSRCRLRRSAGGSGDRLVKIAVKQLRVRDLDDRVTRIVRVRGDDPDRGRLVDVQRAPQIAVGANGVGELALWVHRKR